MVRRRSLALQERAGGPASSSCDEGHHKIPQRESIGVTVTIPAHVRKNRLTTMLMSEFPTFPLNHPPRMLPTNEQPTTTTAKMTTCVATISPGARSPNCFRVAMTIVARTDRNKTCQPVQRPPVLSAKAMRQASKHRTRKNAWLPNKAEMISQGRTTPHAHAIVNGTIIGSLRGVRAAGGVVFILPLISTNGDPNLLQDIIAF